LGKSVTLQPSVLKHAYDENIAAWADAIRQWLQWQGRVFAAISQLQQGTGLSVVRLWLAGLLGGFYEAAKGWFLSGRGRGDLQHSNFQNHSQEQITNPYNARK
jgi:hypothetical protein